MEYKKKRDRKKIMHDRIFIKSYFETNYFRSTRNLLLWSIAINLGTNSVIFYHILSYSSFSNT